MFPGPKGCSRSRMSPPGAGAVNSIPPRRKAVLRVQPRRSSIAPSTGMIVAVHPLAGFDKVLHYKVPEAMRPLAAVGALVRVPVGRVMRLGVIGGGGPPEGFPLGQMKALGQGG